MALDVRTVKDALPLHHQADGHLFFSTMDSHRLWVRSAPFLVWWFTTRIRLKTVPYSQGHLLRIQVFLSDHSNVRAWLGLWRRGHCPQDWSLECTGAVFRIALVNSVPLAHPDFSTTFFLSVDASISGLGAVLSQIQPNEDKTQPTAFVFKSCLVKISGSQHRTVHNHSPTPDSNLQPRAWEGRQALSQGG